MIGRVSRRTAISRLVVLAIGSPGALTYSAYAGQPVTPRRVGVLLVVSSAESREVRRFREALRAAGYNEGPDVLIEWRNANGDNDRIRELAGELVRHRPDVIVVESTPGVLAVKRATSTIPVVMTLVSDPVASGLVANLSHPGANITGLSAMGSELGVKRLQLLKDTVPQLRRVSVIWNPDARSHTKAVEELKTVASSLAVQLSFVSIRTPDDIVPAFAAIERTRAQALCVLSDPQLVVHRRAVLDLALKTRLPAIYLERRFVDEGGLMSYGSDWAELWYRAAAYVDKILKGVSPGDLPVEQPTKLELIINLKTAKALGITIPESVLLRADEVIR